MKRTRSQPRSMSYIESESEDEVFVLKKKISKPKTKDQSVNKRKKPTKVNDEEEFQPEIIDEKVSDEAEAEESLSITSQSKQKLKKNGKGKRTNVKESGSKYKKTRVQKSINENSEQIADNQDYDDLDDNTYEINKSSQGEEFLKELESRMPSFIQKGSIRDLEGRVESDPDYDCTTLFIPIHFYLSQSPMFRQFWNAKKNNFDKIIFFRTGRWMYAFYNDAILMAKLFQCRVGTWCASRPVIPIYESQYPLFVKNLLSLGHKICIIEQTEKGRLQQKEFGEVANREISQLISLGTWQEVDDDKYDSRFLLSLVVDKAPRNNQNNKLIYGVAMVDATTNEIYLDQFMDDEHSNGLRSLLIKIKPLEIIIQNSISKETEKMIKNICNPVILSYTKQFKPMEHIFQQFKVEFMTTKNSSDKQIIRKDIIVPKDQVLPDVKVQIDINEGIYDEDLQFKGASRSKQLQRETLQEEKIAYTLSDDYPDLLQELERQYNFEIEIFETQSLIQNSDQNSDTTFDEEDYSYYYASQALYILQSYLRKLMLSQTVYKMGTFNLIDSSFQQSTTLYLDSQSLEGLEIFQANLSIKMQEKGSLFHYLNQCGSNSGKRLLKKWLASPPFKINKIIDRQYAVKDLVENIDLAEEFTKRLAAFPDFERTIARIFNSLQPQRLRVASFRGESFAQGRLNELQLLLRHFLTSINLIKIFEQHASKFKSDRLKQLVKIKTKNQQLKRQSGKFNKKFKQQEDNNSAEFGLFPDIVFILGELEKCLTIKNGQPTPAQGVSTVYDQNLATLQSVQDLLNKELLHWRIKLQCDKLQYAHGRLRYQLEIPDYVVEGINKPKELVITSKKKGFQRFQTENIENLLFQLKVSEDNVAKSLVPFIQEYFQKFYSYKHLWYQLVSCLAELDCLCSLAIVSQQMKTSCLPQFVEQGSQTQKVDSFSLEGAIHPCLQQQMPNIKWVPNDVKFSKSVDALLLTGPNMSGKSTLLRLTAVSIILAQMGCYVPAKSFTLTPFDRIFCRIGASDRLLEGKSTFFIEMEETKTILQHCSPRSLVIIDELGRGTSTYDGVAIASAVLKHLVTNLGPKTLFATHYHILLDEFALYENILNTVMKHHYNEDTGEVAFTYKLVEGYADKSFAANVARIAGVPKSVIQRAIEMEKKITKEEEKLSTNRKAIQRFNEVLTKVVENYKKI